MTSLRVAIVCILFPVSPAACSHDGSGTEPVIATPKRTPLSVEHGKATWYGGRFHGRKTASGERFDKNDFTCAHKKLPFGTIVRVVNLETDRSVLVRVNDRGPYGKGRIVDVSEAAAKKLGMIHRGVVKARLEVMSKPES